LHVIEVLQERQVEQEQFCLGTDRLDAGEVIQCHGRHRRHGIAGALLDHRLPGYGKIGAKLALQEAHREQAAVMEGDLHHIAGLQIEVRPVGLASLLGRGFRRQTGHGLADRVRRRDRTIDQCPEATDRRGADQRAAQRADAGAQQLRLAPKALQPARGALAAGLDALQALLAALAH
jgi:hypothetical protein